MLQSMGLQRVGHDEVTEQHLKRMSLSQWWRPYITDACLPHCRRQPAGFTMFFLIGYFSFFPKSTHIYCVPVICQVPHQAFM